MIRRYGSETTVAQEEVFGEACTKAPKILLFFPHARYGLPAVLDGTRGDLFRSAADGGVAADRRCARRPDRAAEVEGERRSEYRHRGGWPDGRRLQTSRRGDETADGGGEAVAAWAVGEIEGGFHGVIVMDGGFYLNTNFLVAGCWRLAGYVVWAAFCSLSSFNPPRRNGHGFARIFLLKI